MKGDIIKAKPHHYKAAKQALDIIIEDIRACEGRFAITVAGESGAGKSEVAEALRDELKKDNIQSYIFQQDDYFVYPPHTNAETRKKDISWVGINEVRLDLLDEHLGYSKEGKTLFEKPLVIFEEDRIDSEKADIGSAKVVIAEGTYTTSLKNADIRIFIDRDHKDTVESRKERAREAQDEFLEKILFIEHNIISAHKVLAEIIITKDFNAVKGEKNG